MARQIALHITRLVCVDETEHEGPWFIRGEGLANDAMRLTALVTWQSSDGQRRQYRTPVIDLGSDYEDNRAFIQNHRIVTIPIDRGIKLPLVLNVTFVLIEEDWGGQMDEVATQVLSGVDKFLKEEVSSAVATATGSAIGGVIGSSIGPLGTILGTGVGAVIGWLTANLNLSALPSDTFPPIDITLTITSPNASIDEAFRSNVLTFKDDTIGGEYNLEYDWWFVERKGLKTVNGYFVGAENGGGGRVLANQRHLKGWETFEMVELGQDKVAFRAMNGQFIMAEDNGGGRVRAAAKTPRGWETFKKVNGNRSGTVAFQTSSGFFLCAEGGGGGKVVANRRRPRSWESFTIVDSRY